MMTKYKFMIATPFVLSLMFGTIGSDTVNSAKDLLGKTTAELLELRGYKAINHEITTSDGYVLNVVQGLNPLINNGTSGLSDKDPILFVHGTISSGNFFVTSPLNGQPKNHGHLNAGNMSLQELNELLKDDSTSSSLPFLAMNFGHEAWILNRRGSTQSMGHTSSENTQPFSSLLHNILSTLFGGLPIPTLFGDRTAEANTNQTALDEPQVGELIRQISSRPDDESGLFEDSLNPRYWNFSLDEQAAYDIPEAIDYMLNETGKKQVAYVGHSAGSALALMVLIEQPEYADKLSQIVLWAPALYPGGRSAFALEATLMPLLTSYIGPFPPTPLLEPIKNLIATFCGTRFTQREICDPIIGLLAGYVGHEQEKIPGAVAVLADSVSSHSSGQEAQAASKGKMHHYDFLSAEKNNIAYGQPTPPLYNVSEVTSSSIAMYTGNTDTLVAPETVRKIISDMSVSVDFHIIGGPGVHFNHLSYALHDNTSELIIIPSLKRIEEAQIA